MYMQFVPSVLIKNTGHQLNKSGKLLYDGIMKE